MSLVVEMASQFGPFSYDDLAVDDAAQIPSRPGVYFWRRVLRFDSVAHKTPESMEAWVRDQAECPMAVLPTLQIARNPDEPGTGIRPGYAVIRELRIGGARLSSDELLPEGLQQKANALEFISKLTWQFGPVLYVGESEDLQRRIREHISGATGFARRVEEANLRLSDVALSGVTTESFSPETRRQIELLLTHLVGAPLTRKAGK